MNIGDSFELLDKRMVMMVAEPHAGSCNGCMFFSKDADRACARGPEHGKFIESHFCSTANTIFMLDNDESRAYLVRMKLQR